MLYCCIEDLQKKALNNPFGVMEPTLLIQGKYIFSDIYFYGIHTHLCIEGLFGI